VVKPKVYIYASYYYPMISKHHLIELNESIGENGQIINESSLLFILDYANNNIKTELKRTAYLISNIINQHIFLDGNKRVCCLLLIEYFERNKVLYINKKISRICISISKNNIKDLRKIKFMIKNAIK